MSSKHIKERRSGKLQQSKVQLEPTSRVSVDKVINEIRTLRSRLSEITPPISTPVGNKNKREPTQISFDDDTDLEQSVRDYHNHDPLKVKI